MKPGEIIARTTLTALLTLPLLAVGCHIARQGKWPIIGAARGAAAAGESAAFVPAPPGAAAVAVPPAKGVALYYCDMDIANVVSYYQCELPRRGWAENTAAAAEYAREYRRDNRGEVLVFQRRGNVCIIAVGPNETRGSLITVLVGAQRRLDANENPEII